jgi:4'-phosphopantetheinyl transferase
MLSAAAELHVWEANLDLAPWPPPDSLPAAERDRAARMRRPRARDRWVASRWALRFALSRYLDREASAIELSAGEDGKPALAGPGPLRFNLSHSAGLALVAVTSGREVGVDVERIKPRRDVLALAPRALGAAAADAVREAPAATRATVFHAAWARREAIAKCAGVGLLGRPAAGGIAVAELEAPPGFAAAVAVAGEALPPLRRFAIEPAASAAGIRIRPPAQPVRSG